MNPLTSRRIARGSALVVAMIVLGVLTVIGVAAVSLSTAERANAAAYGKMDAIQACANAATAKIWRELGVYGTGLTGSTATISAITLADGTTLTAPAHYDTPMNATIGSLIRSTSAGNNPKMTEKNMTNVFRPTAIMGAGASVFTVHCKDASGRELEIELGLKLSL